MTRNIGNVEEFPSWRDILRHFQTTIKEDRINEVLEEFLKCRGMEFKCKRTKIKY